jgi:hypothetical protein
MTLEAGYSITVLLVERLHEETPQESLRCY